MKKLSQIRISVLLVLAFCLVPTVVLAEELAETALIAETPARDVSFENGLAADLRALGLFNGVSATNFDLERAPSRIEVLVMLIRVLGKEQEAVNGEWTHPFTDVDPWADKYVGYAYENGLTKGVSATKFGNDKAGAGTYLTFILRALGYSDTENADFAWDNPYTLARGIGILPTVTDTENFFRADIVTISYAALSATLKGSEQTLAQKLIDAGAFNAETYAANYNIAKLTAKENESKTELNSEELFKQCSPAAFYIEIKDESGAGVASGSGFFIREDGLAVTNYHVIEGASSAVITLPDSGATYNVVGVYDFDPFTDWALIQIDGTGFKTLPVNPMPVSTGASVYAIGSPKGLQNSLSAGMISNARREVDGTYFIQTTAAISAGSSGGALLNRFGEVIGITSNSVTSGQNLNFARPIACVAAAKTGTCTPLAEMRWSFVYYYTETTSLTLKAGESTTFILDYDYYSDDYDDPTILAESDDESVAAIGLGFRYGECCVIATGVGETTLRIKNDLTEDVYEIPVTVTAGDDTAAHVLYVAQRDEVRLNAGASKQTYLFVLPYDKDADYYVRSAAPSIATVHMKEPTEDFPYFVLDISGVKNGETTVTFSNSKTADVFELKVVVVDRFDAAYAELAAFIKENGKYEKNIKEPSKSYYYYDFLPSSASVSYEFMYFPEKKCLVFGSYTYTSFMLYGELTVYENHDPMVFEFGISDYNSYGTTVIEPEKFGKQIRTLSFDTFTGVQLLQSQIEGSLTQMFSASLYTWDALLRLIGLEEETDLNVDMGDFGFYNFNAEEYIDSMLK